MLQKTRNPYEQNPGGNKNNLQVHNEALKFWKIIQLEHEIHSNSKLIWNIVDEIV